MEHVPINRVGQKIPLQVFEIPLEIPNNGCELQNAKILVKMYLKYTKYKILLFKNKLIIFKIVQLILQ